MAAFNPQTADTGAQDFTGSSRGGQGNRALETLFSGIGDAVSGAVGTADTFTQNRIEDQARYGLDQLNEGTNSALENVQNGDVKSASSAPGPVKDASKSLQNLAMAKAQGKITNEFYYGQLTSQLKSLRAQYPGYERQVDDIVQRVTGVQPANAYRKALEQNIAAQAEILKTGADKRQAFMNENAGIIQATTPDAFTNPDKYAGDQGFQQIQANVAKWKGDEATFDYESKSNLNNQTVLKQSLGNFLTQRSQALLSGTSKAAGLDLPNFVKTVTDAGSTGGLSDDKVNALTGQFDQYLFTAKATLMQEANRPEMASVSPQDKQAMVDAALAPIQQIKDLISQKQYSQAATIAARNEALQNKGLADLYGQHPDMAVAVGISKASPDLAQYITQQTIQSMGGVANYVKSTAVSDQVADTLSGNGTMADTNGRILKSSNLQGSDKNSLVAANINTTLNAIRDGKVDPKDIPNVISSNYNNTNDIFKQVSQDPDSGGQSQYLKLYTKTFDPKITEQVVKAGDQKTLNQYFDYAVDKFRSIPEIRQAMNTVTQNVNYGDFFRVNYDPDQNKVVVQVDQSKLDGMSSIKSGTSRILLNQTRQAAASLNQGLSVLSPIIEATHGDENKVVSDLIGTLGESGSGKGFFGWVRDSLDQKMKAAEDKGSSGQPVNMSTILSGSVGGFRDAVQQTDRELGQPAVLDTGVPTKPEDNIEFTLKNSTPDPRTQVDSSAGPQGHWLQYANQGATRNKPLSGRLINSMSFLADKGITMQVFSGGQEEDGPDRTGSHRHDDGNAADVFFYKNGRKLDWADPNDLKDYEDIVAEAKSRGVTGFGAGPGYMRRGSMHLGFGTPAVWGAGGKTDNAPSWLRAAYLGRPD